MQTLTCNGKMDNQELNTGKIETLLCKIENHLFLLKTTFNLEEAADYLHVSKSFLYKLTSQNKIAHYKPSGKLVYFEKNELDGWILQNRITPQSEITAEAALRVTIGKRGKHA